ncbi:hypothetical protein B5S28_g3405 [[Candida] boidinii]|nr:hypothetical protein B5S28_g3405 [[Candida] boidinii]OWB64030.1 hypothetical protein B5S29_g5059 [[Candida] boidinii]OWB75152.1 hypothetical protein B5S31_g5013 [[Candida] boidinii]
MDVSPHSSVDSKDKDGGDDIIIHSSDLTYPSQIKYKGSSSKDIDQVSEEVSLFGNTKAYYDSKITDKDTVPYSYSDVNYEDQDADNDLFPKLQSISYQNNSTQFQHQQQAQRQQGQKNNRNKKRGSTSSYFYKEKRKNNTNGLEDSGMANRSAKSPKDRTHSMNTTNDSYYYHSSYNKNSSTHNNNNDHLDDHSNAGPFTNKDTTPDYPESISDSIVGQMLHKYQYDNLINNRVNVNGMTANNDYDDNSKFHLLKIYDNLLKNKNFEKYNTNKSHLNDQSDFQKYDYSIWKQNKIMNILDKHNYAGNNSNSYNNSNNYGGSNDNNENKSNENNSNTFNNRLNKNQLKIISENELLNDYVSPEELTHQKDRNSNRAGNSNGVLNSIKHRVSQFKNNIGNHSVISKSTNNNLDPLRSRSPAIELENLRSNPNSISQRTNNNSSNKNNTSSKKDNNGVIFSDIASPKTTNSNVYFGSDVYDNGEDIIFSNRDNIDYSCRRVPNDLYDDEEEEEEGDSYFEEDEDEYDDEDDDEDDDNTSEYDIDNSTSDGRGRYNNYTIGDDDATSHNIDEDYDANLNAFHNNGNGNYDCFDIDHDDIEQDDDDQNSYNPYNFKFNKTSHNQKSIHNKNTRSKRKRNRISKRVSKSDPFADSAAASTSSDSKYGNQFGTWVSNILHLRSPTFGLSSGGGGGRNNSGGHKNRYRRRRYEIQRKLKVRHLHQIALGATLGVGLLLSSGKAFSIAGPLGCLLGFIFAGLIVLATMLSFCEMITLIPLAGGVSGIASRFVDDAFGFSLGSIYWFSYTIGFPTEITAASIMLSYYPNLEIPGPNTAGWITLFLCISVIINLFDIRVYGEVEYYSTVIKLLFLLGMMIYMIILNAGGSPPLHVKTGFKYWDYDDSNFKLNMIYGPFRPTFDVTDVGLGALKGLGGSSGRFCQFLVASVVAAYAYVGTEIILIAGGESRNPRVAIPNATRNIYWRILIFYILAIFIIGLNIYSGDPRLLRYFSPEDTPKLNSTETAMLNEIIAVNGGNNCDTNLLTWGGFSNGNQSPWVIAIQNASLCEFSGIVNGFLVYFALTAGTSQLYASSRTLYYLSIQGKAPEIFSTCSKRGVPYMSVLFTGSIGALAYLSVQNNTALVFERLLSICATTGLIVWSGMCLSFIRFYHGLKFRPDIISRNDENYPYRSPFQPYLAYFGMIGAIILVLSSGFVVFTKGNWSTVYFFSCYGSLILFILCYVCYKILKRTKIHRLDQVDLDSGRREIDRIIWEEDRHYSSNFKEILAKLATLIF